MKLVMNQKTTRQLRMKRILITLLLSMTIQFIPPYTIHAQEKLIDSHRLNLIASNYSNETNASTHSRNEGHDLQSSDTSSNRSAEGAPSVNTEKSNEIVRVDSMESSDVNEHHTIPEVTHASPSSKKDTRLVKKVHLSKSHLKLIAGASPEKLLATVEPTDADHSTLMWSSTKPEIAEVDQSGNVTPKSPGKTIITVKSIDEIMSSTEVEVSYANALSVIMNIQKLDIQVGNEAILTAKVLPDYANQRVTYWSSDKKIVTVGKDSGVVKAVHPGHTTITVYGANGVTATVDVSIFPTMATGAKIKQPELSLVSGTNSKLTPAVTLADSNQTVSLSSQDTNILISSISGQEVKQTVSSTESSTHRASESLGGGSFFTSTIQSDTVVQVLINQQKIEQAHTEKIVERVIEANLISSVLLNFISKHTASQKNTVRIETIKASTDLVVRLDVETLRTLQQKNVVFEINTQQAMYQFDLKRVNLNTLSTLFTGEIHTKDLFIQFEIHPSHSQILDILNYQVADKKATSVIHPTKFKVSLLHKSQMKDVIVNTPYRFISKWIPVHSATSPFTTGVRIDPNGTMTHVPTKTINVQGKTYIVMQGIETHGDYGVIDLSKNFTDITNHWAQSYILDGGKRAIMEGVGKDRFEVNRLVTRAEFVTMIVRGLGLPTQEALPLFADMKSTDWFAQIVHTAYAYGLITGYDDGKFHPQREITREEAKVMLTRAIRILDFPSPLTQLDENLMKFEELSPKSSKELSDTEDNLNTKTIQGDAAKTLRSQEHISRAEAAAVIIRILDAASLIEFKP